MTGTQVKLFIFVYDCKAIEISGTPAPQTQGFLWFRRPPASTCMAPCDSRADRLSCPADCVSNTSPPQQTLACLQILASPPSLHRTSWFLPSPVRTSPPREIPALNKLPVPRTSRPCLPPRGRCGSWLSCRRPSPINAMLGPVLSTGCVGGVWR